MGGANRILLAYEQDFKPVDDRSAASAAAEREGLCRRGPAPEALRVVLYNEELAKTTSREMVVDAAAGRKIVTAHSSYGLLHYINGTGKAFAELERRGVNLPPPP